MYPHTFSIVTSQFRYETPTKRGGGATAAASVSGSGDEHISKVKAGPLPTLAADGLQECAFVGMCFVIEGLVGALGMIFGAAKDEHDAAAEALHALESRAAVEEERGEHLDAS